MLLQQPRRDAVKGAHPGQLGCSMLPYTRWIWSR
jgi:hypothetical protein